MDEPVDDGKEASTNSLERSSSELSLMVGEQTRPNSEQTTDMTDDSEPAVEPRMRRLWACRPPRRSRIDILRASVGAWDNSKLPFSQLATIM